MMLGSAPPPDYVHHSKASKKLFARVQDVNITSRLRKGSGISGASTNPIIGLQPDPRAYALRVWHRQTKQLHGIHAFFVK